MSVQYALNSVSSASTLTQLYWGKVIMVFGFNTH